MKPAPIVMLIALVSVVCNKSNADTLVSFSPGPGFTTRVHTSWGDYIVDSEPGSSTVWVGTEEEYTNRHALAVMSAQGYRELHVEGQDSNSHTLVNRRVPSVNVGKTQLAQIMPSIILKGEDSNFDPEAHAPPQRSGYFYVGFNWVQSDRTRVTPVLLDPRTRQAFRPFHCWDIDNCVWQLPAAELGVPIVATFSMRGRPPAALNLRSIAMGQYQTSMALKDPLSPEKMRQLHELDPSVPEK